MPNNKHLMKSFKSSSMIVLNHLGSFFTIVLAMFWISFGLFLLLFCVFQ